MPRLRAKFPMPFEMLPRHLQERVLEKQRYYHVEGVDWWDSTYEDARRIGLEITSFDLYRREIDGKLAETVEQCCKLIMEEHGESCATYKLAKEYDTRLQVLQATFNSLRGVPQTCPDCKGSGVYVADWMRAHDGQWAHWPCDRCEHTGKYTIDPDADFEEPEDLVHEFKRELLRLYLKMLDDESEYLESDECLRETFENSDHEFDHEGDVA